MVVTCGGAGSDNEREKNDPDVWTVPTILMIVTFVACLLRGGGIERTSAADREYKCGKDCQNVRLMLGVNYLYC